MVNELPKKLMKDVYWAFTKGIFENAEEFNSAVRQYQIAITEKDEWNAEKEIFPHSSIQIYYDYWTDENREIEEIFELKADNGKSFTVGELLFKINNTVAENVSRADHVFFEGLELSDEKHQGKPYYRMYLGS